MGSDDAPKRGDALLVTSPDGGFLLIHPTTHEPIARNLASIAAAVEAARKHGIDELWQQHVDFRGRPLGDPFRLLRQFK